MSSGGHPVTGPELLEHRLKELEAWRQESAATVQSTVRAVDLLQIESATVKSLLVELRTEGRERDDRTTASLARLHERLDEVIRTDARESGREQGRSEASTRTWKVVAFTVTATLALGGLAVGVLQLASG